MNNEEKKEEALIRYLKSFDLSTFSKDYKEGYEDCIKDLQRLSIKNVREVLINKQT